jgi:hypothetical protein
MGTNASQRSRRRTEQPSRSLEPCMAAGHERDVALERAANGTGLHQDGARMLQFAFGK